MPAVCWQAPRGRLAVQAAEPELQSDLKQQQSTSHAAHTSLSLPLSAPRQQKRKQKQKHKKAEEEQQKPEVPDVGIVQGGVVHFPDDAPHGKGQQGKRRKQAGQ